jgi:flagellar L-ring protein precursor FlgH
MNTPVPTRIFTADSRTTGKGSVDRTEELKTNVAGVVRQVSLNGNRVIEGKQEIRVNFEVRELMSLECATGGYRERQHDPLKQDRAGANRVWRPRSDYRYAAEPYGEQFFDILLPF